MLACLPRPGDLSLQLLSHTQMNTGLQTWDTTQRMRSTQYPSPAELDAYAKKVANHPLTIKIFPTSVKVPQRNHVRRTVNGLDTSGQRYSPYPPSQASAKAGLLAVIKMPIIKGILKDFGGSRARMHPSEVIMNPSCTGGPYAATSASTLNLHPRPSQSQGMSQIHPQSPPRQQSLRHPLPMLQHHPEQGLPRLPALGHAQPPSGPSLLLQQQQHLQNQGPDADAPPNVTVSTSTIPLSMVASLNQGRQPDLSSIVHQINQFCQTRAQGAEATSMCEGQIANPSPISRNLLISASSRLSMHSHPNSCPPGLPAHPSCILCPANNAAVPVHPRNNMATMNGGPVYHNDIKQQQHNQQQLQQQRQHHQQKQQHNQQQMLWNHHHLSKVQPVHQDSGVHSCKHPSHMGYISELCLGQAYTLKPPVEKPTPSPPVNNNSSMPGGQLSHYSNINHYFHPHTVWNSSILPTPNSDSSGSQDMTMPFHAGPPGGTTTLDCTGPPGGSHYRLGLASSSGQSSLMQTVDYLGGDFQTPCFRDQNLGLMGKMHRPPMNRVGPEVGPGDGRTAHIQHPGYR